MGKLEAATVDRLWPRVDGASDTHRFDPSRAHEPPKEGPRLASDNTPGVVRYDAIGRLILRMSKSRFGRRGWNLVDRVAASQAKKETPGSFNLGLRRASLEHLS